MYTFIVSIKSNEELVRKRGNMKRSRKLVDGRRNKVLEVLRENGHVKVGELAEEFGVSPLTIRRDLQYLEDNKKLERFYGGASIVNDMLATTDEEDEVTHYRRLIAKYAASLVEDGDTIFINTSSTALMLLKHIDDKNVIAITNNGKAINAERSPNVSIVLTGGELRDAKEAMVGEFALNNLERVSAKKCFLGCSGLSIESGMTTERLNEVNINQTMLRRATGSTYILADHTKIGKNSSFVTSTINRVKNIITDEKADENIVNGLRAMGIKVHQVSKNDDI